MLHLRTSTAHAHVFVRLCDVDPQGRSWNVTDGILRLTPAALAEEAVTVTMSSAAHQFAAGHRLRLQVSGGAHPRFARNTGTGEPLATATRLVPTDIEVYHDQARPSALLLPAEDTNRRDHRRLAHPVIRVVGPDLSGQRASRHDTPGVQGKQCEQNPQLAATDVDRTARLIPYLKRA